MTDLNRDNQTPEIGGFLERYLPSNFEYDHFAMRFDVTVANSTQSHRLFTNVALNGDNRWRFELPEYYSSSCFDCFYYYYY